VKLASQKARLILTLSPAKRQDLEDGFAEERRLDVRAVLDAGRQTTVEFDGILDEMGQGVWRVGGLPAALDEATAVTGQPYLGARVHVRGYLPGNGQVVMTELRVEPADEPPDGTEPTETMRSPESPETGEPADTPEPSETPEASRVPRPTATREATERPEPTETLEPGCPPEPTEGLEPTETPRATEAAEPSETPHATHTPEPTERPEHQPTPEPSPTPEG